MKALILAPFAPQALERLGARMEVIYESWMDTRQLISPEQLVWRIENDDLSIIVIEADFVFEEMLESAGPRGK